MKMVITNRDRRNRKTHIYGAADFSDMVGDGITKSRVRQIAREHNIGWLQFIATIPADGPYRFPFNADHEYSQEDIRTLYDWILDIRDQHKDLRYRIKLDRFYTRDDMRKLVKHCKKLKKKQASGELKKIA